MTKTYSENIQAAYFEAARKLFRQAAAVLNDCTEPAEFTGQTAHWARERSKRIGEQGYALETLGHEQCVCTQRAETENGKAKREWSDAITRHLRLFEEYRALAVKTTRIACE